MLFSLLCLNFFLQIYFSSLIQILLKMKDLLSKAQVEIRLFCLTGHFWCWCKSHYSSPTATKGFGGAATPLFLPAFPNSAIKSAWFAEDQPFHALLLISIFLKKYHHPLSSCSQHPWNPKQNKADIFTNPTFQEVTQYYCAHTL